MNQEKVLENSLRRLASRRGFTIIKSRMRDRHALGYGRYMLIDERNSKVIKGSEDHGVPQWTLEQIEQFFTAWEQKQDSDE